MVKTTVTGVIIGRTARARGTAETKRIVKETGTTTAGKTAGVITRVAVAMVVTVVTVVTEEIVTATTTDNDLGSVACKD